MTDVSVGRKEDGCGEGDAVPDDWDAIDGEEGEEKAVAKADKDAPDDWDAIDGEHGMDSEEDKASALSALSDWEGFQSTLPHETATAARGNPADVPSASAPTMLDTDAAAGSVSGLDSGTVAAESFRLAPRRSFKNPTTLRAGKKFVGMWEREILAHSNATQVAAQVKTVDKLAQTLGPVGGIEMSQLHR